MEWVKGTTELTVVEYCRLNSSHLIFNSLCPKWQLQVLACTQRGIGHSSMERANSQQPSPEHHTVPTLHTLLPRHHVGLADFKAETKYTSIIGTATRDGARSSEPPCMPMMSSKSIALWGKQQGVLAVVFIVLYLPAHHSVLLKPFAEGLGHVHHVRQVVHKHSLWLADVQRVKGRL